MNQDTPNHYSYEEALLRAQSEWLEESSGQIKLADEALDVIDRYIELRNDDILLCETTCLDYAIHAMTTEGGVRELWLVPPQLSLGELSDELLDRLMTALRDGHKEALDSLERRGKAFGGLTVSTPGGPFKLLVTAQTDSDLSAFEWPRSNPIWVEMWNTEGASGAVLYPSSGEQDRLQPPLYMDLSKGIRYPEGFVRSAELPGAHVLLALGEPTGSFHMEDISDPSDPWVFEAEPITLAVNNGCLIPSLVRSGARTIEETTLDKLASRIGRGTTLSEKDLDIREKPTFPTGSNYGFGEAFHRVSYGRGFPPSVGEFYRYPGDLYYIDGTCFRDGTIRPRVLNSMPEGQGRYIVDSHDDEVLLVSRSSKEIAVYKAISHPTLIGNSVFVIRLGQEVSMDYLACWMRGSFAKAWMHNGGKLLSKTALASLPVPILDDETMEQTVRYERSIDKSIFDLYQEIAGLELSNRFNPLYAMTQDGRARRGDD